MAFVFGMEDLLAYLDRDRSQWHAWFRQQGPATLAVDLGADNTGRIRTVGELVRHIFSAEQRYVQRSLQVPLLDTSAIPADDVEALFAFGLASRRALQRPAGDLSRYGVGCAARDVVRRSHSHRDITEDDRAGRHP
jgi:hypothetical protein